MKFRLFIYIIPFLIMSKISYSQDLKDYRWENRILILSGNLAEQQLGMFSNQNDELEDRKIKIYKIEGNNAFEWNYLKDERIKIDLSILKPYLSSQNNETILIGLDGGIKERWNQLLEPDKLYQTIDRMPMRRSEISN